MNSCKKIQLESRLRNGRDGLERKSVVIQKSAVAVISNPIDPSQILTRGELAQRLKVSERWVNEKTCRRSQNPLPTIRIGRYLRFDWVSVSAWLRELESGNRRAA